MGKSPQAPEIINLFHTLREFRPAFPVTQIQDYPPFININHQANYCRKRVPIFETIFRHGVEAKRPTLRPKRLHQSTQSAHGTIISDAFEHRALGSGRFHDRYFGWPAFIYLYTVIEIQV